MLRAQIKESHTHTYTQYKGSMTNTGVSSVTDPTEDTFHRMGVQGFPLLTACLAVTFLKRTALLWFPQKQQWDNLNIYTSPSSG